MSPYSTSKFNKSFFQSYFWTALLALFMAVVLSQWAVADPQSQTSDPQTIEQETTEPLEIPPLDEQAIDSENTPDATPRIVEPVPNPVIKRVPKTYDDTPLNNDAMHENTTPYVKSVPLADKCYEQKDGSFECVCEGKDECETLKTAEHCAPGTHWGKDGFGGCTKK